MGCRTGLFVGSFNPYHKGHASVVEQALGLFDRVIVARGVNPDKPLTGRPFPDYSFINPRSECMTYECSTVELVGKLKPFALIRGIRDSKDLEYEGELRRAYKEQGLVIPIIYFLVDEALREISSSKIRQES